MVDYASLERVLINCDRSHSPEMSLRPHQRRKSGRAGEVQSPATSKGLLSSVNLFAVPKRLDQERKCW